MHFAFAVFEKMFQKSHENKHLSSITPRHLKNTSSERWADPVCPSPTCAASFPEANGYFDFASRVLTCPGSRRSFNDQFLQRLPIVAVFLPVSACHEALTCVTITGCEKA